MDVRVMQENRIKTFDYAKGIAIIAMIIGHISLNTELPGAISHYIHIWNMPLFFCVSGFFFRSNDKYSFKMFVIKQAKGLMIPYFIWGCFSWLVYVLFNLLLNTEKLDEAIQSIKYVVGYNNVFFPISGGLWFLSALFFIQLIYYMLNKVLGSSIWMLIVTFIISMSMCLVFTFATFRLPFSIDSALTALFFFAVGHWASEKRACIGNYVIEKYNIGLLFLIMLVCSIIGFYINEPVNIRTLSFGNPLLFYVNAIVSTICILLLARILEMLNKLDVLLYIGKNSVVYLIFNQIILAVLYRVFDKLATVPQWLEAVVSLVVVVGICSLLAYFLVIYFPQTIGKRKNG